MLKTKGTISRDIKWPNKTKESREALEPPMRMDAWSWRVLFHARQHVMSRRRRTHEAFLPMLGLCSPQLCYTHVFCGISSLYFLASVPGSSLVKHQRMSLKRLGDKAEILEIKNEFTGQSFLAQGIRKMCGLLHNLFGILSRTPGSKEMLCEMPHIFALILLFSHF